jgi:hypothetical protein
VDSVTVLGGKASQLSALAVAIQEQQPDEWTACYGRMTAQSPVDVACLLANLFQQLTTLLQVQSESVRLQRVLVEQSFGTSSIGATSQPELSVSTDASSTVIAPSTAQLSVAAEATEHATAVQAGLTGSSPVESVDGPPSARATEPATSHSAAGGVGVGESGAYSTHYYRARPAPALTPVQPQDLELMRRLHEVGDASGLIVQFGPHKGATLAQVAMHDPDYVRQLVIRAQRPEVRAAAGRLVEALDAAAAHKPRAAHSTGRRSRPTT